jgi:hypothetical protein
VQEQALFLEVVIRCATHELQIAVGLMDEKKDWRTIPHVLADKATLVASEGVPCEADVGVIHATRLKPTRERPQVGRQLTGSFKRAYAA